MNKKITAIILAGGTGERMNKDIPKQFLKLAGKPLILYTLEKFDKNFAVTDLVVVCHEDYLEHLEEIIEKNGRKKSYKVVSGGRTRQESSFIGVKNCPPGTDLVLIHDAARPFVDDRIIGDVIQAADEAGASGPVIETGDTIIVQKGEYIDRIPDRNKLKRIQTPQGFRYDLISRAHQQAIENGIAEASDDCGLVVALGKDVKTIEGSALNIKITDEISLYLAEKYIQLEEIADEE